MKSQMAYVILISSGKRLFMMVLYACSYAQEMTLEERQLIMDLNKCDFGELHAMHKQKVEARKNMSKEEKLVGVLYNILNV